LVKYEVWGWRILKEEHSNKYMLMGRKIAYYRKLKGLTQEQLAEKVEISAGFFGGIEAPNVKRTLSLDTLFDISDALDIPPHKFLQFDDDLDKL
jgi:transcriptional regulator with XRE-family HTH domain